MDVINNPLGYVREQTAKNLMGDKPKEDTTKIAKVEVKVSFVYPRVLDREQHLFLSSDYKLLLDIQEEEASIYELYADASCTGNERKVKFLRDVKKLPFGAFDNDAN